MSALITGADGAKLAAALAELRLTPGERVVAEAWIPIVRFGDWDAAPSWLVGSDVELLHRAAVAAALPHLAAAFAPRSST